MAKVKFTIEATMDERWVDDFCSMLNHMERCGDIGHSSLVGFYADGDGNFRPHFNIDRDFKVKKGIPREEIYCKPEIMFDAG